MFTSPAIDNRTGRRTRRSVGPSDPGPPTRRSQPADLGALMANYNPQAPRRDAFPRQAVPRIVPVVVVASLQAPPRNGISPLKKYLDSLKKDYFLWDVDPNHPNYLNYFHENEKLELPSGQTLLNCFACEKCSQVDHRNMFACFNAGHLLCRSCCGAIRSTDRFNHFLGKCELCQSRDVGHLRSIPQTRWELIRKLPLKCKFNELGCSDPIYEPNYGNHTMSCPVGWRCFLCFKMIRADEMEEHFVAGHPALTYLVPRAPVIGTLKGNAKLEFDVRIPYMSEFAVCRFTLEGLGSFVLYQLQLDEYEMIWIVVKNGSIPENATKVTVDIELTATSIVGLVGDRSVYSFKWTNRIHAWRTRLIHSIRDVMEDDESLSKTAKFNFKTLAEAQGQRNFRCTLSLEVKEIVSGAPAPSFGLVDPQPVVTATNNIPIAELQKLTLVN